jgi:hypothetical protein
MREFWGWLAGQRRSRCAGPDAAFHTARASHTGRSPKC